jgi:hypothetical protein
MIIEKQINIIIEKIKIQLKVKNDVELAEKLYISQNTISTWRARNSIEAIKKICVKNKIYNEIFNENEEKIIEEQIEELKNLMKHEEIIIFLKEKIMTEIIKKFEIKEKNIFIKFLNAQGPTRNTLFLYYICQLTLKNLEKNISNYQGFLIKMVEKFPTKNILINQPIFTNVIKKEFVEIIKNELTKDECSLFVNNCDLIIKKIEENMPVYVVAAHKNKFKKN